MQKLRFSRNSKLKRERDTIFLFNLTHTSTTRGPVQVQSTRSTNQSSRTQSAGLKAAVLSVPLDPSCNR